MLRFDHNHEKQNKELKMHGGTLNLNDECIFTEWSVAAPEVARVIADVQVLGRAETEHDEVQA